MPAICNGCPGAATTEAPPAELMMVIGAPTAAWTDQQLVQSCLQGDERAWALLLGRYRNLIQSFPRKYGASPADAADVYQLVSVELVFALPRLRNQESVRSWIITVSARQACQWKRRHLVRAKREQDDPRAVEAGSIGPSLVLEEAEQARLVRDAIAQLAPRCQRLLKLLFYEDPPVSYQAIADQLGLAYGSVGFLRARCLRRLQRVLTRAGVRANLPAPAERILTSCDGCS